MNKEDPKTWRRFSESLCASCIGSCCMMPVEVRQSDLVRLGLCDELEEPRAVAKRLQREGIVKNFRDATGLFTFVQQSDESCVYLDRKSRLCVVYDRRPDVCRKFPLEMGNRKGYCPYKEKT